MSMIVRRPSRSLSLYRPMSLMEQMEEMARDMWESWPFRTTGWMPPIDLYEYKDELIVKAEFPGIDPKDIDISLEGDVLTIKAEKTQEKLEDVNYLTCERSFGKHVRRISLPYPVEANKISSTFQNGVLEVRLPKSEEVKPKRISVKVTS